MGTTQIITAEAAAKTNILSQAKTSATEILFDVIPTNPWVYFLGIFTVAGGLMLMLVLNFWEPILTSTYLIILLGLTAVSAWPGRTNPMDINLEFRNSFVLVVAALFGPWMGLGFGFAASVVNELSAKVKKIPEAIADVMIYTIAGGVFGLMAVTKENFLMLAIAISIGIVLAKAIVYRISSTTHEIVFYSIFTLIWILLDLNIIAPKVYDILAPLA